VQEWTRELKGKPVEVANEIIVADGTDESYEAFAALYQGTTRGLQAKDWLDRHRRLVAWNKAVLINSASGYREFLALYPDSDLTVTARKLAERLRYRPEFVAAIPAPVQNASLNTCPCGPQPAPQQQQKKVDVTPIKKVEPDPPKRAGKPRRYREPEEEVVVVRRPPPAVVYERAPPVSIGIGIGMGGGGVYRPRGGESYGGGSYGGGNYGGQNRMRGGY
jgi:hypothetical protein